MEKKVKIIVFVVFVILVLFFVFSNMIEVRDENRNLPSNEDLDEFNNVQTKNDANTYEVKDVPNKELATIYYNHFKDLVVNNSEEAYKRIRNKDVVTLDDFNSFRNNLINNYYNNKVIDYRISGSTYIITNSDNQTITFYVDAVFKYQVEL